jgi:hypothetical protein
MAIHRPGTSCGNNCDSTAMRFFKETFKKYLFSWTFVGPPYTGTQSHHMIDLGSSCITQCSMSHNVAVVVAKVSRPRPRHEEQNKKWTK